MCEGKGEAPSGFILCFSSVLVGLHRNSLVFVFYPNLSPWIVGAKVDFDGENHGKRGLRREGYHPLCISVVLAFEEGLKAGRCVLRSGRALLPPFSSVSLYSTPVTSLVSRLHCEGKSWCYLFLAESMAV